MPSTDNNINNRLIATQYPQVPSNAVLYWPSTQLNRLVTHSWANWIKFQHDVHSHWRWRAFSSTSWQPREDPSPTLATHRLTWFQQSFLFLLLTFQNIAKGPEGWILLTRVTSLGHIASSNTSLDQISSSESQPSVNFKISTKHQHFHWSEPSFGISTKI